LYLEGYLFSTFLDIAAAYFNTLLAALVPPLEDSGQLFGGDSAVILLVTARSKPTSGLLLYFDQKCNSFYHKTSNMKRGAKNGSLVWIQIHLIHRGY
jgi:hypothetical protein